ncbi:2-hydroxy-3-oxopropionate reductase [Chitinivorax tropicus]|uniref:2-hydroxy-3-oxopropionate reductase n=1 Tax=Chitinivorax tropicus TaxID=714531 RepID=A0A840MH50_9PROT|nr:2-hydroxy-3-oxopropionate reductase [Chitinivorax tropicus]MBB5016855.1 2-hydroxy-3-oxopropionate reductase [Chitinivorax tropicus]
MTKPVVGYIGLGIMGRPTALNLIKAGYTLHVYARRAASLAPLLAEGAQAAASPCELARVADILFVNVSDTPDVEQVLLGEQGVIEAGRAGQVVVDMSTIAPLAARQMAERLAERGIDLLDAPVSGGEAGAIAGTLSIMVGGKASAFERALPLLQVLGKNIVHVGDSGAGQVAKACNQIVVAGTIAAVAEALTFARRSDVDAAKVRDALMGGFAGSKILEVHGKRMLDGDFRPGFKSRLHQKDMHIVLETARQLGLALPISSQTTQLINALLGLGQGEMDSSAMIKVIERMSGD